MILLLAACHVFQALDIPCTEGHACPSSDDTGTTPDGPVTGAIVSYASSPSGRVVGYSPDGTAFLEWTDVGPVGGTVAWSTQVNTGVLAEGARLTALTREGNAPYLGEVVGDAEAADVDRIGNTVWVALGDSVYAWDFSYWFGVFQSPLSNATHIATDGDVLFVTAEAGDGVDVYAVDTRAITWEPLFQGLNGPRARNVFVGPEGKPYACSAAGYVYALDALDAGDNDAVAFSADTLTDVVDCGYDPGDGRYLLFSPTLGVLKVDDRGIGETLVPLPDGVAGVRANFFR